eukprot:m51a1_g3408 hypothetical protein (157) ;mRNA; r:564558-565086
MGGALRKEEDGFLATDTCIALLASSSDTAALYSLSRTCRRAYRVCGPELSRRHNRENTALVAPPDGDPLWPWIASYMNFRQPVPVKLVVAGPASAGKTSLVAALKFGSPAEAEVVGPLDLGGCYARTLGCAVCPEVYEAPEPMPVFLNRTHVWIVV